MALDWLILPTPPATKPGRQGRLHADWSPSGASSPLRHCVSDSRLTPNSPSGRLCGSPGGGSGVSRRKKNLWTGPLLDISDPLEHSAPWLPHIKSPCSDRRASSKARDIPSDLGSGSQTSRPASHRRSMSQGALQRKSSRPVDGSCKAQKQQHREGELSSKTVLSGTAKCALSSTTRSVVGVSQPRPVTPVAHPTPPSSVAAGSDITDDDTSQESNALREISAVAASIAQSLDNFERCCSGREDQLAEPLPSASLKEIRSTSYIVQAGLVGFGNEFSITKKHSKKHRSHQTSSKYNDATLVTARELNTLANLFCQELDSTSSIVADDKDDSETTSVSEFTTTTKQIFEDMDELVCESWAAGALSSISERKQPDVVADSAKGGAKGGERKHSKGPARSPSKHAVRSPSKHVEKSSDGPGRMEEPKSAMNDHTASRRKSVDSGTEDKDYGDVQAFLARQQANGDISDDDIQRWQIAFKRFKVPDTSDLHTGDVMGLLEYLGHVLVQSDIVTPLLKEVTKFDYLDFDEFVSFMERFLPREKQRYAEVFQEYDEDASGEISVSELKHMLHDLGFIPLQAILHEALAIADSSGNGELDFDEFQAFMAVYRRFEGFTKEEVRNFRKIFDHYSRNGEAPGKLMPAEELGDALVQGFGLHVSEFAESVEEQIKSGQGLQKSAFAKTGGSGKQEHVTFSEYLIFARKTREASLSKIKVDFGSKFTPATGASSDEHGDQDSKDSSEDGIFDGADLDGDGLLSVPELRELLKGMGYTPLRQNLEEVFYEVDKDCSNFLDFDEFFDFMMIYRQREGFSIAAVENMREIFEKFDTDGSQEISALELAEIFRELGYKATLEKIHVYVLQVDLNGSNHLDFREFLRLMRLHREEELKRILSVFDNFKARDTGLLDYGMIRGALRAIGHDPNTVTIQGKESIDFEKLVHYADIGRAERVKWERKNAGFAEEKIALFRESFNLFDKDRSGEIDSIELLGILKEFDWQPQNREEQKLLVEKLEAAKAKAREAGVPNTAEDGSIDFWTFVQLCRILETEHEHAEEERLHKLMDELNFSAKEVEEFRLIYHEKKESLVASEEEVEKPNGLPRQALKRLIFMLGVEIKGEKKSLLDERLDALCSAEDDTLLDFEGFLRLMRWLLNTGWLEG